ncbi:MAG: MarR family transcriptional regulator [Chloroflexota bacterium]|nr:winged helix DNA-binding protein [Chloroflexota bacterium]MDE3103287.1 MarR family transcriptional regulator [Chloroflexota bacterium]
MLARVRRALRAVNTAVDRGSQSVGITRQQQSVLLALAAHGGRRVPLADVRAELNMDQATASILLGRLVRGGLLVRERGADRRAADLTLTPKGRSAFRRSLRAIRAEMRSAERRGELAPLNGELALYLRFHFGRSGKA